MTLCYFVAEDVDLRIVLLQENPYPWRSYVKSN
jgi:hypothetical protein